MDKFFWYAFVLAAFTLALVYYQGLVSDANTILPYGVQFAELFQGRNPQTGNFSGYATTGN